jgi:heavy metal sensor kinase
VNVPIRTRLTAWYAGLLVLILVAMGAFVVLRLRADLVADSDHRLDGAAGEIARGYQAEGLQDFHDVAGTVLPHGDAIAQLVTADGHVVAHHGSAGIGPPIARIVTGRTSTQVGSPPVRYRVLARPVERGGRRLTLLTGESLAPADRAVQRVLVLMLVGGGAALLLTAGGGWWLARKALRPVERMTEQADSIGDASGGGRLEVPATRDEVAHLARTLNAMLDRLDRGAEDKRRLVADASHELRAPLAVMRSELDVALADPSLGNDARAVLASSREEVDRMARMVGDMLTLASIDEGRLELIREPVDLRALSERVAARLRARAEIVIEGEHVRVEGDSVRIEHALSNLLDNAIKFGGDGVRVATWSRNGEVGLAVTDDGPGVPSAERERVFERFVRLDPARGRSEHGSGLGLAICREVALAHGGRAWVESRNGSGGSRFLLALPGAES